MSTSREYSRFRQRSERDAEIEKRRRRRQSRKKNALRSAQTNESRSPEPIAPPISEERPLSELQRAWMEWLSSSKWTYFVTLTWRPKKSPELTVSTRGYRSHPIDRGPAPESIRKAAKRFLRRMHIDLFGENFGDKVGLTYAVAYELKSGRWHAHLLLAGGEALQLALWRPWKEWWNANFGSIHFDRPNQEVRVMRYVTKYAVKGGEIDFPCHTWKDEEERRKSLTPCSYASTLRAAPCHKCGLVSMCECNRVHEDQLPLFSVAQESDSDLQVHSESVPALRDPVPIESQFRTATDSVSCWPSRAQQHSARVRKRAWFRQLCMRRHATHPVGKYQPVNPVAPSGNAY